MSMQSHSATALQLVDSFGRVHRSLRVSVTDRCNIRCFYCMPAEGAVFSDRKDLLTFEEIERLALILVQRFGISDIRITGGEPLVRRDLEQLIKRLAAIQQLQDLSLTTNGILLTDQAARLQRAGLRRLNISLDTLDQEVFKRITRRDGLEQTIAGIDAAIDAGFDSIKLNALAIAGVTEGEIVRLVRFAADRGVTIRFIEFMPLDSDGAWLHEKVLTGEQIIKILEKEFGSVMSVGRSNPSQPAEEFRAGQTRVGVIRSVTKPFCGACDRLRLTADGAIRNCLFASEETPIRDPMRAGCSDDELVAKIHESIRQKKAAHGIDDASFQPPQRKMYAIGG